MSRSNVIPALVFALCVLPAASALRPGTAEARDPSWLGTADLAGAASRPARGRTAFQLPVPGLSKADLERFFRGQTLFDTSWVPAPSPVTDLDGLGPTFNRVSCGGCHVRNGRGAVPHRDGEPLLTATVRVAAPNGADHPRYGRQINERAIPGVPPEGRIEISWISRRGRYGDGTAYVLRMPVARLVRPGFGALAAGDRLSLRIAQPLPGAGLLAAVDEAEILAKSDPGDKDGDGISGRPNWRTDPATGKRLLGRFGWKAGEVTLEAQNARAALTDIGLTSRLFPRENCPPVQRRCARSPSGGTPELSDTQLAELTFYTAALAVPTRRQARDPAVLAGGRLFVSMGCAACHRPALKTSATRGQAWARGRAIHPFTDLLLHDMGAGLADNFPEGSATGREWRTPPLWGIGLTRDVTGEEGYLHDGRARSLAEAILWHGGEAERAKEAFRNAGRRKRDALVAFLRSL